MATQCVRPTAEIFSALSLFTFAFNAITMPQLIQNKVCHNKYNNTICGNLKHHPKIENEVQSTAAHWMSILPLSALLPGLFMMLMVGSISDVIGKKRTMIIPPAVYFVQSLLFILLVRVNSKFSPGLFILPYCLSGLFGDSAGCGMLSEAYISSVTTSSNRTLRLAILESALFIGQLSAALSSGFILGYYGFVGGFVATAIVNGINFLYVLFLLPSEKRTQSPGTYQEIDQSAVADRTGYHTDTKDDRETESLEDSVTLLEKLNPLACLRRIREAICAEERRERIAFILCLFSLATFINMGEIYLGILYIKHSPFNLDAQGIGFLIATQGLLRSFGLMTIPYLCQRFFNFKDTHLVIVGFGFQLVYFVSLGFSTSSLMLYLVQIIGIPIVVHLPVFRSMVSKLVDREHYGSAIAAVEAVSVANSLLTSLASNQLYSKTVNIFAGFTVILLGLIAIPGLIGALIFAFTYKDRDLVHDEKTFLLSSHESQHDVDGDN